MITSHLLYPTELSSWSGQDSNLRPPYVPVLYLLSYRSDAIDDVRAAAYACGNAVRTGRDSRTRTAATRRFIDRALAPLAQRQSVWRQEPPNPSLRTPVPQNRDCFRGVSAIDGRKTKRPRGQASRGRSWCRGRSVVRSPVHVQDQIGRF